MITMYGDDYCGAETLEAYPRIESLEVKRLKAQIENLKKEIKRLKYGEPSWMDCLPD